MSIISCLCKLQVIQDAIVTPALNCQIFELYHVRILTAPETDLEPLEDVLED